jgi:hypothetical protein
MKHLIAAISLLIFSVAAGAQTGTSVNASAMCKLTINQSPSIRGIQLGMKLGDVLNLFPGAEQSAEIQAVLEQRASYPHLGITDFEVFPSKYSTKERFRGIGLFHFTFIDDRLVVYEVGYASPPAGPMWPRVDDWVTKAAASLNLPAVENWTTEHNDRVLKCEGFQIHASNLNQSGNLSVATLDLPYQEQRTRVQAFNEKLRRDFKP